MHPRIYVEMKLMKEVVDLGKLYLMDLEVKICISYFASFILID